MPYPQPNYFYFDSHYICQEAQAPSLSATTDGFDNDKVVYTEQLYVPLEGAIGKTIQELRDAEKNLGGPLRGARPGFSTWTNIGSTLQPGTTEMR